MPPRKSATSIPHPMNNRQRNWTDKDGNTRYSCEIIADSVYFAGAKVPDVQGGADPGFDPFAEEAA